MHTCKTAGEYRVMDQPIAIIRGEGNENVEHHHDTCTQQTLRILPTETFTDTCNSTQMESSNTIATTNTIRTSIICESHENASTNQQIQIITSAPIANQTATTTFTATKRKD
eukprot:219358_1